MLEQFYKTALRRIQHLPENTATPVIYLLLGCIPIEGQIHIQMLTFFASILRKPNTIEYNIIMRQLALKDLSSNSWVVQVRVLLDKYGLPSPYRLLDSPPVKSLWKQQVSSAVSTYWMEDLKVRARVMKTLELVDIEGSKHGQVATVWRHNSDPLEAHMATVKARVLVQRYPLGCLHYAGSNKRDTCVLCGGEEETVKHFILACPSLAKTRKRYISQLHMLLLEQASCDHMDSDMLLKIILTPARFVSELSVLKLEQVSRRLIYKLHCSRSVLLGNMVKYSDK